MRLNSDMLNKNLTNMNKKLYDLNLLINSLKLDEKNVKSPICSLPQLKIKILSVDAKNANTSLTNNLFLTISQAKNQLEMPLNYNNTLSIHNYQPENMNNFTKNKSAEFLINNNTK